MKEHANTKIEVEDIKSRMHNIIIEQKELQQKIENIKENLINSKDPNSNRTQNGKYQPAYKAILYGKYIPNKARIVVCSNNKVKTYRVSVDYQYQQRTFYIDYKGKWTQMKYIIHKLKEEGLVYEFRNIIKVLRSRYNNNKKQVTIKEETGINNGKKIEEREQ